MIYMTGDALSLGAHLKVRGIREYSSDAKIVTSTQDPRAAGWLM